MRRPSMLTSRPQGRDPNSSRITLVRPLAFDRKDDAQAYAAAKAALPLVEAESDRLISGDLAWR